MRQQLLRSTSRRRVGGLIVRRGQSVGPDLHRYRGAAAELAKLAVRLRSCGEDLGPLREFEERRDKLDFDGLLSYLADVSRTADADLCAQLLDDTPRLLRAACHPSVNLELAEASVRAFDNLGTSNPTDKNVAVLRSRAYCNLGSALADVAEYHSSAEAYLAGFSALESSEQSSALTRSSTVLLKLNYGRLLSKGAGLNKGYEMQARLNLEQALHLSKSLDFDLSSLQAEIKSALALVLTTQTENFFVQAEQLAQEAIEAQEESGDVIQLSESLNSYGMLLARQGRKAEANQLFQRNLSLRRKLYRDAPHVDIAEAMINKATLESKAEAALPLYQTSVEILQTVVDKVQEATSNRKNLMALALAPALDGLAVTLTELERFDEACVALERGLRIRREKLLFHRDTALTLTNLAHVKFMTLEARKTAPVTPLLLRLRNYLFTPTIVDQSTTTMEDIDSLLTEAIDITRKVGPSSSPFLADALSNRAVFLLRRPQSGSDKEADKEESRRLLQEALNIQLSSVGGGQEGTDVQKTRQLLEQT